MGMPLVQAGRATMLDRYIGSYDAASEMNRDRWAALVFRAVNGSGQEGGLR